MYNGSGDRLGSKSGLICSTSPQASRQVSHQQRMWSNRGENMREPLYIGASRWYRTKENKRVQSSGSIRSHVLGAPIGWNCTI